MLSCFSFSIFNSCKCSCILNKERATARWYTWQLFYSSQHLFSILLGLRDCHLPPQIIYLLCLHEAFRDLGTLWFLKQWGIWIKIAHFISSCIFHLLSISLKSFYYWSVIILRHLHSDASLGGSRCYWKKKTEKYYYGHVVSPSYSLAHYTDSQSKLSVQIQVAQDLPNLLTFKY